MAFSHKTALKQILSLAREMHVFGDVHHSSICFFFKRRARGCTQICMEAWKRADRLICKRLSSKEQMILRTEIAHHLGVECCYHNWQFLEMFMPNRVKEFFFVRPGQAEFCYDLRCMRNPEKKIARLHTLVHSPTATFGEIALAVFTLCIKDARVLAGFNGTEAVCLFSALAAGFAVNRCGIPLSRSQTDLLAEQNMDTGCMTTLRPEPHTCCVCSSSDPSALLLPCMHNVLCMECAENVCSRRMGCPVCRAPIEATKRIFT